ncbi:hypothetical protein BYT27DRAFT_7141519 [Phlegmacium glaucopus]|nr:hypothetical protein BYT27DRAFT_7141519 [Phlegmacium glaucopus]
MSGDTSPSPLCPKCSTAYLFSGEQVDHSHLLSLLRSGHVPEANEKASILTSIEECAGQIDSMNTQLSRLKSIMNKLKRRRSELDLQMTHQSGLLSPIRRLPNELLSEILLYSSGGRVDVCSPRSDIWKFEKVCKRWREVSLSSEVWSSIDVPLESMTPWKPGTPMAMVTHLVDLCLRRSRDRSLSVKFMEIGSPDTFKDIFDILSRYSHRWEELFVSLSMLRAESPILDHGLTRLSFLRLTGAYKGPTPLDTFKHAQQLRRLQIVSVDKPLRSLLLPWAQITDFKAFLCQFRPGEFMEMLQAMPNVVRLISRWNKGIKRTQDANTNPIHLRRLKTFELEASPSEMYTILQPLTFPLLTDLTLVTSAPSTDSSLYTLLADSVVSAVSRSFCRLTSLSLRSVDSACVSRILRYTRSVRHLELGYIHFAQVILQQLIWPSPFVPRLRSFSLECIMDQGATCIGSLASVIRSRSHSDDQGSEGCLRMVNLTLREKRGVDPFVAILQPLGIETGVGIVIHAIQIGA